MEGEIPTLKCEAYTTIMGEIQNMTTIEHGSTDTILSRLMTLKNNLLESHTKVLIGDLKHQFLDCLSRRNKITSVSADTVYQLKRKANITYSVAKMTLPNLFDLSDLVSKEGNLDKEKDIRKLYLNKKVCPEFILSHGEVIFEKLPTISWP